MSKAPRSAMLAALFCGIENVRLVMTEIMIWLAAIALLIAGLGIQYSWNSQGSKKDGAKSGGVYVEGVIGNISTLNPLLAASEPEQAVSRLLFSSLYNYDVTGALHTDLAESMTVKDDKAYTIKLRNAVWHEDAFPVAGAEPTRLNENHEQTKQEQSAQSTSLK